MSMKVEPLYSREELHQFLEKFGESNLPSEMVAVDVIRDGDKLVGAVMQEQVVHVGPTYLLPEYLGGTAGALLVRRAIQNAEGKEMHVLAVDEQTEQVCERLGLKKVDGTLWIREAE